MNPFSPRQIIHIDGDSFFASCEISLDASLKGKPVVTGKERGIATAMSPEAKALGIGRGMPIFQIKKLFPEAIIRSSDYQVYSIFAERMYSIVRRYTPMVEEYSIDECFADITGSDSLHKISYAEIAQAIKNDLKRELGMTFSIGLGPSKVLAKIASKKEKPDGLVTIKMEDLAPLLRSVSIGKVWGIGPQTSILLQKLGVSNALDFVQKPEDWIKEKLDRPQQEIWHELRGKSIHPVRARSKEGPASIQTTRTFTPPSKNPSLLYSELSKNIERACAKARQQGYVARQILIFLKTQEFRYHRYEFSLSTPTASPHRILDAIKQEAFHKICKEGYLYRATGVTLAKLIPAEYASEDLFGQGQADRGWKTVLKVTDAIDRRFGSRSIILGSSLAAQQMRDKKEAQEEVRVRLLWKKGKMMKPLRIPYMGEAS